MTGSTQKHPHPYNPPGTGSGGKNPRIPSLAKKGRKPPPHPGRDEILRWPPSPVPEAFPRSGAKGEALLRMAALGAPVPPGFILTSDFFRRFTIKPDPDQMAARVEAELNHLARLTGTRPDTPPNPLLVSLRPSPIHPATADPDGAGEPSHPALLNLGMTLGLARKLTDGGGSADGLAAKGAPVWDGLRRFVLGYCRAIGSTKTAGIPALEALEQAELNQQGVESPAELDGAAMERLTTACWQKAEEYGPIPATLTGQLMAALTAWGHPSHSFPPVVVQAMAPAFTPEMLSGTLFTRHPATGIPMDPDDPATWYGKTLDRALGPDLTGGLRIPSPLNRLSLPLPSWALDLARWANRMEQAWGDALEIGFTVTEGRLVLLKAAPCHRTAEASLQIALDLTAAGWTTLSGGLDLVQPDALNRYLHPVLADPEREELFTTGLGVSPGSAVGQVVFLAQEAEELAGRGIRPILVCRETTPEDLGGLSCAEGILTATGGPTSHAAVVARGMGKCCVVGASQLRFNPPLGEVTAGDHTVRRLDWLSLDGNTGRVYLGAVPQVEPRMDPDLARLLKHADTVRKLGVYANADTPQDGAKALEMGAGGIGLCRTEHMFFHPERIPLFRKMILAGTPEDRLAALAALEPLQRDDFEQLFRVMNGRPVTIRLLDPPLHEFLPAGPVSQAQMAKAMGLSVETVRQRAENLAEANPMLGHRGCRLGITFPEIYLTQAKAIVEAACRAALDGLPVAPEIMIPLISLPAEFIRLKELILPLCRQTMAAMGISVPLKIGTMIETPRATLCAGEIARHADFFSFGTNDLTQMTFGFSRDDSASFLPAYVEKGVLKQDPFVVLDEEGVGALVRMAVLAGRKANPRLTIGICGEHGGEPRSIEFSHRLGLDYVSCSPYRIPIARLASAQSALKYPG